MSDHGRQSFTDKAEAAFKVCSLAHCGRSKQTHRNPFFQPDSQKTTTEHFGDKLKGNADSAASTFQPQGEKSYTQKVGDTFSSNSNHDQVCHPLVDL